MVFITVIVVLVLLTIVVGAIQGMIALARVSALTERLERMQQTLQLMQRRAAAPPPMREPALASMPAIPVQSVEPDLPVVDAPPPQPQLQAVPQAPVRSHLPPPVEHQAAPAPVEDMESTVGKRWLTWAGVAVLFLAAVFFFKYAYDQGWIGRLLGPRVRIALIAAASITAVVAGLLHLRRGLTALGQGLAGGGIALGYLAIYGAFAPSLGIVPEPLLPAGVAFALMGMVSASGMVLAVRCDAMAMAVVATLGGLATPLLVSTGHSDRNLLAGYLLLLDLAVLGACMWRHWRGLDLLAFAGTAILLALASTDAEYAHPDVALLGWLAVFHPVFLCMAFALPWRTRTPVPSERYGLALANIALAVGWSAYELSGNHAGILSGLCFALAGAYHGIGTLSRRRIPSDAGIGDGFNLLCAVLVLLGIFYLMPVDGIATAWAVEACALAWLGYRHARPALRWSALVLICVVIVRCFLRLPAAEPTSALIVNSWFISLLAAPAGCLALAWVHRRCGASGDELRLTRWLVISAIWLLMFFAAIELDRHADGHDTAWQGIPLASVIAMCWTVGATVVHLWAMRQRLLEPVIGGLVIVTSAIVAAAIPFCLGTNIGDWPLLDLRSLAALLLIAVLAWSAQIHRAYGWAAYASVVALLSLEPSQWCYRHIAVASTAEVAAHLSVTVAWTLCAAGLLAWGFLRRLRSCRIAALALFGLTAGKLLLVDMADAQHITRIIAFLVVGLMLIAASYAYHRLARRLAG